MKRLVVGFALTLILSGIASAGPILAGTVNGVLFCATDNNTVCLQGTQLPDLDPSVGSLSLGSTTLGGVTVLGSFQQQIIGPTSDVLNSSSLQIINNTLNVVAVALSVSGINFIGPVTSISTSGAGTFQNAIGSTINMQWYADMLNGQGGDTFNDFPGTLLSSCGKTATVAADAFSCNAGPIPFADLNLFSMTQGFTMNLAGGGSLINRGQTMLADIQPVPEPATMLLLGTGLLAAVRVRRKVVR